MEVTQGFNALLMARVALFGRLCSAKPCLGEALERREGLSCSGSFHPGVFLSLKLGSQPHPSAWASRSSPFFSSFHFWVFSHSLFFVSPLFCLPTFSLSVRSLEIRSPDLLQVASFGATYELESLDDPHQTFTCFY